MKQSHWLLCEAKELWLLQENHAFVKLDSCVASRGMKTYIKSRIELRNENAEKKRDFLSSANIDYCRSWMTTLGKLAVVVNTGGHSIWVLNEKSVSNGGNFRLLWLVILKIVSKTHFSCNAVGRELWLAILCSLLFPEVDWNIRIGKQGYVFI